MDRIVRLELEEIPSWAVSVVRVRRQLLSPVNRLSTNFLSHDNRQPINFDDWDVPFKSDLII